MELRVRPTKGEYLQNASWEELYILSKHWQSDMAFYRDECRFLNDLMSKYFIWLVKDENISHLQDLAQRLTTAAKEQENIVSKIIQHIKQLEALMENSFTHDVQKFRDEHVALEDRFAAFVKSFRTIKKEIFTTTEHVLEEERLKRLLTL